MNARERDEELEKKKKKKKKKEKKKKNDVHALQKRARFPARVLPRRRRPAWKHGGSNAYNLDLSRSVTKRSPRKKKKKEEEKKEKGTSSSEF